MLDKICSQTTGRYCALLSPSEQDVLNGLDLDLEGYFIDDSCMTGGSYWAGKDIAMVARAASISRAFGTDHYLTFDTSLRACLDKWIRVDGRTARRYHRHLYISRQAQNRPMTFYKRFFRN